jgi:hypothetical protein
MLLCIVLPATAVDWSIPEEQLARKVAGMCGSTPVMLTIENRSSIGRRSTDIIQNGLKAAFANAGVRLTQDTNADQLILSLSENLSSYVWVAKLRKTTGETLVGMVSIPRPMESTSGPDAVPLLLKKVQIWSQENPILDLAVLDEAATPTRIAVLSSDNLSLYREQGGKWQQEQILAIGHDKPWPRDLRGRLVPARDHLLDVYLPGIVCRSSSAVPLTLACREGDDPWPLVPRAFAETPANVSAAASVAVPILNAFFSPTRNFFTGALTPPIGRVNSVPKFFSAAAYAKTNSALWVFAAVDGQIHAIDATTDRALSLNWSSDLTSVKTACGAGWQVIAGTSDTIEMVRAFEFPDRDPVPVSPEIDLPGPVTAMWQEYRGDTAIVVAKNKDTGMYEAFRLAVACSQ